MYKLRHLAAVAIAGFEDMRPAVRQAFNARRDDDRLDEVFGTTPRINVLLISIGGLLLGRALAIFGPLAALAQLVHLPALLIGAAYALLFRRFLFASERARPDDFPWLAASLVPAAAALVLLDFGQRMLAGGAEPLPEAPAWTALAVLIDSVAQSLVVAAALVIAVAALCFSRNWMRALVALFSQLIVFKIMVFVMVLLLVKIGIVGPLLAAILDGLLGIRLPDWLGEVADRLTHAALMGIIYLFIIGATWSAARDSFELLLAQGEIDILATLKRMARPNEISAAADPDGTA
ncbi:MAG: hypothetical protein RQ729_05395 [Wenzhouxiangellaceae bacterium]|nr:hypothetical protein [Wenzhouxiangellaceae bacterium]